MGFLRRISRRVRGQAATQRSGVGGRLTPLPRSEGSVPAFVPAEGSPYESGNTGHVLAEAVTFSPDGRLLVLRTSRTEAEDYWGEGSLSVFEVGEGGALAGQREIVPDEPE